MCDEISPLALLGRKERSDGIAIATVRSIASMTSGVFAFGEMTSEVARLTLRS